MLFTLNLSAKCDQSSVGNRYETSTNISHFVAITTQGYKAGPGRMLLQSLIALPVMTQFTSYLVQ